MKFAFAAIVVGLNIILWEGCSSSNGTTTQAPTTARPTTRSPTTGSPTTGAPTTGAPTTGSPTTGAPTTGGPTTTTAPPSPAPNGVFTFNGTVQPLGDLTGEVQINNASTPSPLMTKMLVASKANPDPPLFVNTKPVPFKMEGDKIKLTDLSGFAPVVREYIESATFTYALDKSITVALTKPIPITIVFDKVKSSSGRLLRETHF